MPLMELRRIKWWRDGIDIFCMAFCFGMIIFFYCVMCAFL